MSSSDIKASNLGHICLQCIHRRVSATYTNSHVMEVEIEDIQEDCRHARTWRGHARYCVCDIEEHLSYHGKTQWHNRYDMGFETNRSSGPFEQC